MADQPETETLDDLTVENVEGATDGSGVDRSLSKMLKTADFYSSHTPPLICQIKQKQKKQAKSIANLLKSEKAEKQSLLDILFLKFSSSTK